MLGDLDAVAHRALRAGGFETRVEPNPSSGHGSSFTPPLWLIQMFASSRRARRVLADLIPAHFPMPAGVLSVNVPILTKGTVVQPQDPTGAVAQQHITDAAGSSLAVTFAGQEDVALQLLEQSPPGAHIDWALMQDMTQSYDADIEAQLLNGLGTSYNQLLGVANVAGINPVTFTQASPTGSLLYPFLGQAASAIGDNRDVPPEVWLMRTARWSWLATSEDTQGLPFGLPSPFFMGNTDDTPDPIGGLIGWPVFLDDAITATGGAGGNQDTILSLRPSDILFFEGNPQISVGNVYTEPGSGSLSVKIGVHDYAAAITNRYPTGISVISGTGMVVQSGF